MPVQVKAPGRSGGWFWVKEEKPGMLSYSIYETNALPNEQLERCRKAFPELEFRSVNILPL